MQVGTMERINGGIDTEHRRYPSGVVLYVPIEVLEPWEFNPSARGGNDTKFNDLKRSLSQDGQIVPLFAVRRGEKLKVWDGCRRLRAAQTLDWTSVQCLIFDYDSDEMIAKAIISNSVVKPWDTNAVLDVGANVGYEAVRAHVPQRYRNAADGLFRMLSREELLGFVAKRLGVRAYKSAVRVQNYMGYSEEELPRVLHWFVKMQADGGVIRQVEQAIEWSCPRDAIEKAIKRGQRLQPRW